MNLKPEVSITTVQTVLQQHWGRPAGEVSAVVENGNFSTVYYFTMEGAEYVILFNQAGGSYLREQYIADLLSAQGVRYPKMLGKGTAGSYRYCISERIQGNVLADCHPTQKVDLLDDLVQSITAMNQVRLPETTTGFGPVREDGNGEFPSWLDYVQTFFAKDQTGTFWENWHDLFHTTCLERDIFEECFGRLLTFSQYNAPYRHFVHNDCHAWNILSDGKRITGIIDSNALYGDFLIDVATIEDAIPGRDVAEAFRIYAEQTGRPIHNFAARLTGARYFKGLDGMRFYAKMGYADAYAELRDSLLALPTEFR
ncbi:phosphotransferase family protein [Paenibacillus gorillae]|uniref:phosphotransferase family protein n=1 Tax=Paenibacillus gorillae TaxID=1243662 RepID=UPI0004ADB29E|nr:aminoglycoside phosphotransferase family protein [Paenibacillus gorillae]